MYFLSLVAIVKDEHPYIQEFINYYKLNGVEHFYFYDNGSHPPMSDFLKGYPEVTVIPFPGEQKQISAYNHNIKHFGHLTEWAAFFDIDEFILPKQHPTFAAYLKDQPKDVDCISFNWVIFGNGGHEKKPEGGFVIDHYRYSEGKQHKNVKSVVRPSAVKKFLHPHFPTLKWFKKHTNALGSKMRGAENFEECRHVIQLNHYFTKSLEEYQRKLNSKRADNGVRRIDDKEAMKWLFSEPERCSVSYEDEICVKFLFSLKKSLTNSIYETLSSGLLRLSS